MGYMNQALVSGGNSQNDVTVVNPRAWNLALYKIKSCIDWTTGLAPTMAIFKFGDSVSGAIHTNLNAALTQRLGDAGQALAGMTDPATVSGTVTTTTTDHVYRMDGITWTLSTGAVIKFGRGGGPGSGTIFTCYLAKYPGAGSATVEIIDNSGTPIVYQTPFTGSLDAPIGVQIVKVDLGTAVASRWIRVTNTAGIVKVIGCAIINKSTPGVVYAGMFRGGLAMADCLNMNAGILAAIMADLSPDIVTYSMKDGATEVATYLPQIITRVKAGAPKAEWIIAGASASLVDVGLPDATRPSFLESEAAKAIAITNGYMFIDTYKVLGKYEDLLARDATYDGAHPNLTEYLKLFAEFLTYTGMTEVIGPYVLMNLQLQFLRTATIKFAEVGQGTNVGEMLATGSNNDLTLKLKRAFNITDVSGTGYTMLHINAQSESNGVLFKAHTHTLANAQLLDGYTSRNGMCVIHIDQATNVASLVSRVNGVTRTLTLGTLA